MNISLDIIVDKLYEAIENKDVERTLLLVLQLEQSIQSDPEAVKWITDPHNIKTLHEGLVEHLDVGPKMMMVKQRVPNRQRRARLFIKAIENGVRRML